MTITNGYLTLAEASTYIGKSTDAADQSILNDVVSAVSRLIDRHCGRHFYTVTATRHFDSDDGYCVDLGPYNDLVSVTTLKSDDDGDGVFETTWSAAKYQLLPVGAATRAPHAEPFTSVELLSGNTFPVAVPSGRRGLVEINGTWGWPTSVPVEVKQAARLLVGEMAKLQDAPFGTVGNDVTGFFRAPQSMPARARQLLAPFVHPSSFGVG